jgi:predicted acetyltransferase
MFTDILTRPGDDPPKGRMRVLHRNPEGEVDGFAAYDPSDDWVHNQPKVKLNVNELIATNDVAFTDLVKYFCAVDWVTEVHLNVRPIDEDVRHLLVNGRSARQIERSDNMWVRILDIPVALATRAYESPFSVVLDIRDDMFGGGRYRLESDGVGRSCDPTGDSADVALDIDVLGAAYLGGASLAPYVMAGRIEEFTPGSVAALDRGMRTAKAPWAPTGF